MLNKIEVNNLANPIKDTDKANPKLRNTSPIVEIFSAMVEGNSVGKFGKKADVAYKKIKDLGEKAYAGDNRAKAELNAITKFMVEPKLNKAIQLFDFMGTFKDVGYNEELRVKTYKHEGIRSNDQAIHGDVPFATTKWSEYTIGTKNIASGYAIDYREIASGNLDKVGEGVQQVENDMMNKAMRYVIKVMYDAIKNANGVKYFNESSEIQKTAIDDIVKKVRRFGRPAIMGDYSVITQLEDFQGYDFEGSGSSKYKSEAVMEEIRKFGFIKSYKGSPVVELPNEYNMTKKNSSGDNFALYLPQGLMFFVPQGEVAPLQIFRRGGISSMTGQDITSGTEVMRYDMEIGADLAKGREFEVGLARDTQFTDDAKILG